MLTSHGLIGERYRAEEELSDGDASAFIGRDERNGERVLLVQVECGNARALDMKRVAHPHLACVLDAVLIAESPPVLVCELVEGKTLADRLRDAGALEPVDAVRAALRLADALSVLHELDLFHGCVSERGVMLEPHAREAAPILSFVPSAPDSALRSPTRRAGEPAGVADDCWACAALLFEMLVGRPPPNSGFGSETVLLDDGVADASLRAALASALHSDASRRSASLRPLRRELARWFVAHARDESIPATSGHPPPLPAGAALPRTPLAAARSATLGASRRATAGAPRRRVPLLAVSGVAMGLAAAYGVSVLRGASHPAPEKTAPAPASTTAAAPSAIQLDEVPVTGDRDAATGNEMATCVAGYLPKGAFARAPDVSWLCAEAHAGRGADRLRAAVIQGAPRGAATNAIKVFGRLGWYDLAAFAVVRAGCCPHPPPLELPEPAASCPPMADALQRVATAVIGSRPFDDELKSFRQAVHCEVNAGRGPRFRRADHPQGGEESAFLELIASLRE
jgi:hypothetical protein